MKLYLLYKRRWWLFYAPMLVGACLLMWWSTAHWFALPPTKVVIAGGTAQSSFARLAQRYANKLESVGINVDIVYAGRANHGIQHPQSGDTASIGFGHGIDATSTTGWQALAVIDSEPVWIFSSVNRPGAVRQLAGTRVAAGSTHSPSFSAFQLLLEHSGVRQADIRFQTETGAAAAQALATGAVDVVVAVAGDDVQLVETLSRQSSLQVLEIEQAGLLASRHKALQPLLLPEGALELGSNLPPRDVTMASLQTHLLVRPDVHPALQRALLNAAVELHEEPAFLQRHGQFPTYSSSDFPLSSTAKKFSQGNVPLLETLLPYRKAQWAALLLFAVLPIVALTILILAWIPRWFDWKVNSALHHFYGDLKFLESEMENVAATNPMGLRMLIERLDAIEQRVVTMDLPNEFSDRWYTLREHLAAAQERMFRLRSR